MNKYKVMDGNEACAHSSYINDNKRVNINIDSY